MDRFRRRFGERVALLHSRMPAGARYDEWRRLRSGEARICVGPRSAIFAPVADLGLVVIDEEHDPSYKQEGDPRYDAREVARRRCELTGAALVCGTATPRPESWQRLPRLELPRPGRRTAASRGRNRRHARRGPGPAPSPDDRSFHRVGARRGEGDPPDQPAWLVDPSRLPLLRARLGVPRLRRFAGPSPRAGACDATTAAIPSPNPRRAPNARR